MISLAFPGLPCPARVFLSEQCTLDVPSILLGFAGQHLKFSSFLAGGFIFLKKITPTCRNDEI